MPRPMSKKTPPSLIQQIASTLLTLLGISAGFALLHSLQESGSLPISSVTDADWKVLALTTIAVVWAQSISQIGSWTILSGFFLGLLSVSLFAKAPHTSYAITTWAYGAEQGVLGALLATASLRRVHFWFLKKPTLRMGFFLLIALGANLFFGYRQLSIEPKPFYIFSMTPVVAGFSAALFLWILRRIVTRKKSVPDQQKPTQTPSALTQPTLKPKPSPSKQIKPQKKTQPLPPSQKHQKKKNKSAMAHSPAQKTKAPETNPTTDSRPAPPKPNPIIANPKPLPKKPVVQPDPKPTPQKENPATTNPTIEPRIQLAPESAPPSKAPAPAPKPPPTPPNKPQPSVVPHPAPDSPSEQDDLSSAYDLLDRIKKKQ